MTLIYDFIGLRQPELYIRNTLEIADFMGRTLKYILWQWRQGSN